MTAYVLNTINREKTRKILNIPKYIKLFNLVGKFDGRLNLAIVTIKMKVASHQFKFMYTTTISRHNVNRTAQSYLSSMHFIKSCFDLFLDFAHLLVS